MSTHGVSWEGPRKPLRALCCPGRSWRKGFLSFSGGVGRMLRNSSFPPPGWPYVSECSPQRVAEELFKVPVPVRSSHDLLLALARCSCFSCVCLYSWHTTRQPTFVPLSHTCSVDKAFLWCCCTSFLTFFFLFIIASHDPWQTQLPQHGGDGCHQPGPWKNPVLLTDTFVVPGWGPVIR